MGFPPSWALLWPPAVPILPILIPHKDTLALLYYLGMHAADRRDHMAIIRNNGDPWKHARYVSFYYTTVQHADCGIFYHYFYQCGQKLETSIFF